MVGPRETASASLFLLAVLLFSSLSPLAYSHSEANIDSQPSFSASEELEARWDIASPSTMTQFKLEDTSGKLHLRFGSFDPTTDSLPQVPHDLSYSRPVLDRLAVVQLVTADANLLNSACQQAKCTILEHIPDDAWLVRLPTDVNPAINSLVSDPNVRWVGGEPAAWRLHETLVHSWDNLPLSLNLVALPAPDLTLVELQALSEDIERLNAAESWCDHTLCAIIDLKAEDLLGMRSQLATLAGDGRLLFTEPSVDLRLFNSQAAGEVGITTILSDHKTDLDGSGEVFTILDTGLDADHPDFGNRVLSVRTSFSYDQSPADTNSGHGTHVAGTIIGDGGNSAVATGLTPAALLHMYALEYDISGTIAKTGSTYDILRDASIQGARVGINAWGSSTDLGQYNLESRSLDVFSRDYPDFLSVFAVGDDPTQGSSAVAPPSTAKNLLSIGASDGGTVANFSALGPVLDGRIKPDLVAPGVGICSTRAEEARYPVGTTCGGGTHANGDDLYMAFSGTSPATAVAGASAGLMRQFLRQEAGIPGPSADLVKAALINGALDLGSPDIPNEYEGWGQIDLMGSMYPGGSSSPLSTWYDSGNSLSPGFGFIYTFDLDANAGMDITLVWTDAPGSSTSSQSQSRLVNDLDLVITAPDGTTYLGNDFANGASTTGGASDTVNNVERIRIPSGTVSTSGTWTVNVMHRGGEDQSFAIVVSGDGSSNPGTDLAVFPGSIYTSQASPLVNDLITLRLTWVNQAPLATGTYNLTLEDLTTGSYIINQTKANLDGGKLDSISLYHTFTSTGEHHLRFTLDVDSQVTEINDEVSGVNNNVLEMFVNVSAIGVRLIPLKDDLTEPADATESQQTAQHSMNASTAESHQVPIRLRHEGTGQEVVTLSITNVQALSPNNPNLLLSPDDQWDKQINVSSPLTLEPAGVSGDVQDFMLNLTDIDADLSADPPRYARAGEFVVDITARYQNYPQVSHSLRIYLTVERVDDVVVVAAGTGNLMAEPGHVVGFSVSVMNTGNTVAQHSISCSSEHGWPVEVGPSNSGSLDFEPLNILEYLPMHVRLFVPPVVGGSPAAGTTDLVTCVVTSSTDPSLNHTETAMVTVSEQKSFTSYLKDSAGNSMGPTATAPVQMVDTGDFVNMTLEVVNLGNVEIPLTVRLQAADPMWPMQVSVGDEVDPIQIGFDIGPGEKTIVTLTTGIPLTTSDGSENAFTLTTRLDEVGTNVFVSNGTVFRVGKLLGVTLENPDSTLKATLGTWSQHSFWVNNTGNAPLQLNWSTATGPEGWQIGLDSPPDGLTQLESSLVIIGAFAPDGLTAGLLDDTVRIRVNGTYGSDWTEAIFDIGLEVLSTAAFRISSEPNELLQELNRGGEGIVNITVTNIGNAPGVATLSADVVDGDGDSDSDWSTDVDDTNFALAPGQSLTTSVVVQPSEDAGAGLRTLLLSLSVTADTGIATHASEDLELATTVEAAKADSGIFGTLSTPVLGGLVAVIAVILTLVIVRLRRTGGEIDEGETLVAPGVHTSQVNIDERRASALMEDTSAEDDLVSGGVSDDEVSAALVQSMGGMPPPGPAPKPGELLTMLPPGLPQGLPPALASSPKGLPPLPSAPSAPPPASAFPPPSLTTPPAPLTGPPLPPEGLPAGWTMEQWTHYGEQWLRQHGR